MLFDTELISAVVGVLQKLYQDLLDYKPHEVVDQKISRATGSPVFSKLGSYLMLVDELV